jgi:hypothetical protein
MAALHSGRILHNLLWQRCCSIDLQPLASLMHHIGGHPSIFPGTRREDMQAQRTRQALVASVSLW